LVELHFLSNSLAVENYWRIANEHLKDYFSELFDKVDDADIYIRCLISDAEHTLNLFHDAFADTHWHALLVYGLPI
jgi:hypothetical protein